MKPAHIPDLSPQLGCNAPRKQQHHTNVKHPSPGRSVEPVLYPTPAKQVAWEVHKSIWKPTGLFTGSPQHWASSCRRLPRRGPIQLAVAKPLLLYRLVSLHFSAKPVRTRVVSMQRLERAKPFERGNPEDNARLIMPVLQMGKTEAEREPFVRPPCNPTLQGRNSMGPSTLKLLLCIVFWGQEGLSVICPESLAKHTS